MSDEKPRDLTVALRQMAEGCLPNKQFPVWFLRELNKCSFKPWEAIFNQAADELEAMQKLNGRLLKRLAGD